MSTWQKTVYIDVEAPSANDANDFVAEMADVLQRTFSCVEYVDLDGPIEEVEQ